MVRTSRPRCQVLFHGEQMKEFNILLVEDDDLDAKSVQRSLKKLNVANPFYRCKNGEEGLKWLQENPDKAPLVILLDLNMPRMGGLEFLEKIRGDGKNMPVVVLTTSDDEFDIHESYKQFVSGYILKPVTSDKFLETMAAIGKYWSLCELPKE